ncbi:hypothetical protein, partial [Rhodovulum sulfidophilum]|uniref:hypothetical protein n=1 Tax=Rhodovulum sulfidophilum TaxID=35806 RepID=UPI001F2CA117
RRKPHEAEAFRGDQASSRVKTAQMILAVLLAMAMVASQNGFLSSGFLSHGSPLSAALEVCDVGDCPHGE